MLKVMIADDEPYIREGLEKLVDWDSLDCKLVYSASNGKELVQAMQKDPPDLAIVDIKMPEMDGLEVAEYVMANELGVSIIFLTAYTDFQFAQKAIQFGVSDYVVKTSALEDIPEAIRRIQVKRESELARSYRLVVMKPVGSLEALHQFYKHALSGVNYRILELGKNEDCLLIVEKRGTTAEDLLTRCNKIKMFTKTFLGIRIGVVCSWPFEHKRESSQVYELITKNCEDTFNQDEVVLLDKQEVAESELENESLLARVQNFVAEHYHEKLTLTDIAQAVHVSSGYLSRFYKAQSGENLFDTINSLRIQKAKELLEGGNKKIYEIAKETGFDDTAYFSKVFKKYAGCPPKEYEHICGR